MSKGVIAVTPAAPERSNRRDQFSFHKIGTAARQRAGATSTRNRIARPATKPAATQRHGAAPPAKSASELTAHAIAPHQLSATIPVLIRTEPASSMQAAAAVSPQRRVRAKIESRQTTR